MNSVDKAALPLDVAITRRFCRVHCAPDLVELSDKLGLTWTDVEARAQLARAAGDAWKVLTVEHVTVMLLERLNFFIAEDLGTDFELGHGLVWPVVEAPPNQRWEVLLDVWERALLPQLVERFAGNRESLRTALKIGSDSAKSVYRARGLSGSTIRSEGLLELPSLLGAERAAAMNTLRWLAV
jgi:5-methylcytosine-specific restriction protein B